MTTEVLFSRKKETQEKDPAETVGYGGTGETPILQEAGLRAICVQLFRAGSDSWAQQSFFGTGPWNVKTVY